MKIYQFNAHVEKMFVCYKCNYWSTFLCLLMNAFKIKIKPKKNPHLRPLQKHLTSTWENTEVNSFPVCIFNKHFKYSRSVSVCLRLFSQFKELKAPNAHERIITTTNFKHAEMQHPTLCCFFLFLFWSQSQLLGPLTPSELVLPKIVLLFIFNFNCPLPLSFTSLLYEWRLGLPPVCTLSNIIKCRPVWQYRESGK